MPIPKPPVRLPAKPPVTPSRGGTPVTAKNAPGYRSAGIPIMPASKARGFSKGGSASKRADGCAQRGKTRGKMV